MSHTTMYKVHTDGTVKEHATFRNAFRGAAMVWNEMSKKYLGRENFFMGDIQPVWGLSKHRAVPLNDRIVMMITFDKIMIKCKNLLRVVEAIKDYATRFDPGHLLDQAEVLQELSQDKTCSAVCWNQTSVCENPWWIRDGDDEGRAYDTSRDSGHWFLFQELAIERSQ